MQLRNWLLDLQNLPTLALDSHVCPHPIQKVRKVARQGRLTDHWFAGHGVLERNLRGVQTLTSWKRGLLRDGVPDRAALGVLGISYDRMTDVSQMHAHLMSAARMRIGSNESMALEQLKGLCQCARRSPHSTFCHTHFLTMLGIGFKRGINHFAAETGVVMN